MKAFSSAGGAELHPSPSRTAVEVARQRVAGELAACGRPFAAFAAAVLACRGRLLLSPAGLGALLGVPVEHVHRLESGWRPPDHAPRRLAAVVPDLDWSAVGVDPAAPGDRAARHPSRGQLGRDRGENGPP